jgi:TRAP-type C4-dicarboxylate transport system substrate-binding protein
VLVNKKSFDALDKPTQDAVLKAAADAEVRGAKLSEEKNDWYKKALAEKGMKIMKPPAKLMTDMRQVGTIMLADWEKKAGADGQALVGAYRK